MSNKLILLAALAAVSATAAPAWRWVDENGVVHYSDRPVPGAEEVELPGGRRGTVPAAAARETNNEASSAAETRPVEAYREFEIVSPAQQETLWNIGGNLSVQVALLPGLQEGHRLDVLLDGQPQFLDSASTTVVVPNVFRGLHTVQALIRDTRGTEILRSQTIEIMVQQTSLLNPNNPNAPRPRPPTN
jgi:hypothetical protein